MPQPDGSGISSEPSGSEPEEPTGENPDGNTGGNHSNGGQNISNRNGQMANDQQPLRHRVPLAQPTSAYRAIDTPVSTQHVAAQRPVAQTAQRANLVRTGPTGIATTAMLGAGLIVLGALMRRKGQTSIA